MLAWLLKLLMYVMAYTVQSAPGTHPLSHSLSLNIRSSFKALAPARPSGQTRSRTKDESRRSDRTRKKQIKEELTNVVVWVSSPRQVGPGRGERRAGERLTGSSSAGVLLLAGTAGGPDARLGRPAVRDLQGLRSPPHPRLARTRTFLQSFPSRKCTADKDSTSRAHNSCSTRSSARSSGRTSDRSTLSASFWAKLSILPCSYSSSSRGRLRSTGVGRKSLQM